MGRIRAGQGLRFWGPGAVFKQAAWEERFAYGSLSEYMRYQARRVVFPGGPGERGVGVCRRVLWTPGNLLRNQGQLWMPEGFGPEPQVLRIPWELDTMGYMSS